MSNIEMGTQNPEYQFGQDTIISASKEKITNILNSSMSPEERISGIEEVHRGFEEILEGLDKAKGQ